VSDILVSDILVSDILVSDILVSETAIDHQDEPARCSNHRHTRPLPYVRKAYRRNGKIPAFSWYVGYRIVRLCSPCYSRNSL
jgi:hypothetical protein